MERSSIQVLRTPAAAIGAMALAALVGSAAFVAFEGGIGPSAPLAGTNAAEASGPLAQAPVRVATPPTAAVRARAARFVQFEPNRGQADAAAQFVARSPQLRADVRDDGIDLTPERAGGPAETVRLRFADARRGGGFDARERGQGSANYLVGNDPSRWLRDLPYYKQLRYAGLYEGIDLVYYSRDGELEYDFVVQPNADPLRIRMKLAGKHAPTIDAEGNLRLDGADGTLRLHKPVLYQHIDGEKKTLAGDYVLLARNEVGFRLPAYDRSKPLIIDPTFKLLYSTYLTGFHDEQVGGVALDAQGNAYVVGRTDSEDFVVSGNALQTHKSTVGLQYNVVITKFDAAGTLVYSTYLGGTGNDIGSAIAVDTAGRAYVTGNTTSRDFPVTAGAQQAAFTGSLDVFLAIVSADGSTLAHSTLYGGSGSAQATAIALDGSGAVLLSGTAGPGLSTTAGVYKPTLAAGDGAFVAKFSGPAGGAPRLLAASYFAVDAPDANSSARGNTGFAMALDAAGAPWITGQAYTTNLPTTAGAVQSAPAAMSPTCAAGPGPLNSFAFVARLSADLRSLLYASYLSGATEPVGGAACAEFGRALAIDAGGSVYLTGGTASAAFPTTPATAQPAFPGSSGFASYSGFVTKLRADGGAILWSTYLGGNGGNTFPAAIAYDAAAGAVWTTSVTGGGANYPITADALQRTHGGGGADATLVQLDAASGALKYSTFLGGNSADVGLALAVSPSGDAYVAGNTFSTDFPLTANAYERSFRPDFYGGADWFFSIVGNGSIARVEPAVVGNAGDVTLQLAGAGMPAGDGCALESSGAPIAASLVTTTRDGDRKSCTFVLAGVAPGSYDLVLTGADGSVLRRRAAVQVQASTTGPVLAISMVGRPTARVGTPTRYQFTVTNSGDANAYAAVATVSLPSSLVADFKFAPLPPAFAGDPTDYTGKFAPERVQDGVATRYIVFPFIAAGRSATLDVDVTALTESDDVSIQASVCTSGTTSIDDWKAYAQAASASRKESLAARRERFTALIRERPLTSAESIRCFGSLLFWGGGALATAAGLGLGGPAVVVGAAVGTLGGVITQGFASAAEGSPGVSMTDVTMNGAQSAIGGILRPVAMNLFSAFDILKNCDPDGSLWRSIQSRIRVRFAIDPNDKSGPSGDGSAAHNMQSRPLVYQIAFENKAAATLPAADVVIIDRLDPTKVDLSTLTLGNIRFGSHTIPVPAGVSSFATTYPIDAAMSVRVQGSVDVTTGVLKWTLQTIDPATRLPPSDPTLGFLPPDTDGAKGQGYVAFSVSPRTGLADGTTITNEASIVFDANAAIATPTWTNTIDSTAPASRVLALTGRPGTTDFDVAWSGSDARSGIAAYTVLVSDNGAPFEPWQAGVTATTAVYSGTSGHTYAFQARARDGAGNVEAAKSAAEATIAVNGAFADPALGASGSGGGCSLGGRDQRDVTLPLLVLLAAAALAILRRRPLTSWRAAMTPRRAAD